MDPFTLSAALLSVVQLTNTALKLVRNVNDLQNPKIDLIRTRLITQRTTIQTWAQRFGVEEGWGIPLESVKEVELLFRNMQIYWQRAQDKMNKILSAPDGKMTSRVFIQRFLFISTGFDDLKNLIDVIDAMNEALQVIALQPPSYYSTDASPLGLAAERTTLEIGRSQTSSDDIVSVVADETAVPVGFQSAKTSIGAMYTKCTQILDVLSWEAAELPQIEPFSRRLKQWGNSLFQGSASLDTVLEPRNLTYDVIVQALTYIAVIEESLLRSLCTHGGKQHSRFKQYRTTIAALLGSEPMSETSVEIWANLQHLSLESLSHISEPQKLNILESSEIKKKRREQMDGLRDDTGSGFGTRASKLEQDYFEDLNSENLSIATEELERTVVLSISQEDDDTADSTMSSAENEFSIFDYLSRAIDLLFDVGSTIRALRRAHFLRLDSGPLENSAKANTTTWTAADTAQASGSSAPMVSQNLLTTHINKSLDLALDLERILSNDETWAKENGQTVKLYTPILRKERERLEEFKRAKLVERNPEKIKTSLYTIGGLERALSDTIRDVEVKEKAGGKSGFNSQMDIKFSGYETDKKLAELLDVFKNSNTELWGQ